MLNVFFTVDVEIWCDGWDSLDTKFPDAFRRYIYGPTDKGNFGLPHKLNLLNEYGLKGVFFIEPLFSLRFGSTALDEVVGLVKEAGHEIQLHIHTEWLDEVDNGPIADNKAKRQFMHQYSLGEQEQIIEAGLDLLKRSGAGDINAFRAGSFGFNLETLTALARNNINVDSSYNAGMPNLAHVEMFGELLCEPSTREGISEYPMTVYNDGSGGLRHTQLGACSFREFEGLLWKALEENRRAFVILSHNFELLNTRKNRVDGVVAMRMEKLFQFFNRHRDCFSLTGFSGEHVSHKERQPMPLSSPVYKTGLRVLEQLYRRRYQ